MTQNETEVRHIVEDWAQAVRNRDKQGILARHTDDFVMFDVPPPFQSKGLEAYWKTWETFCGWTKDAGVFDIIDMTVVAGNDVAFCYAVMRCAGYTPNGEKESLQFRLTVGLVKIDGQWLIKHEHHSVPSE
jgi:uncharacterized protein (TIGR02246 family)